MNTPESSEYLPLQAYNANSSSIPVISATRPTIRIHRGPPAATSDLELGFLRVVGRNNVPIIPLTEVQFDSSNWQSDGKTRSGLTMQVHEGTWGMQKVALKRIKKHVFSRNDSHSTENAMHEYHRAMLDQGFELQIMSKASLRNHRNIVTLLAVTFDPAWTSDADPTGALVLPILVVEHADARFPDLGMFFDPQHNPTLPTWLPFDTIATLIADIADGVAALHNHDIVHADLKPGNILIFPDNTTSCGLVAKVADFGFSGMTTYTSNGIRVPGRDPPRGGTAEWNAPECVREVSSPVYLNEIRQEQPFELASRDVYSFGLLASYIALGGQAPGSYVQELAQVKQSDKMTTTVKERLEAHYQHVTDDLRSIEILVSEIVDMTLSLDHTKRMKNLSDIRSLLFGDNPYRHPTSTKFVLNFNLIPNSLHLFKCEGLYRAYWQSPPAFRDRVHKSFKDISSGNFAQYISPDIMRCLEKPESDVLMD